MSSISDDVLYDEEVLKFFRAICLSSMRSARAVKGWRFNPQRSRLDYLPTTPLASEPFHRSLGFCRVVVWYRMHLTLDQTKIRQHP